MVASGVGRDRDRSGGLQSLGARAAFVPRGCIVVIHIDNQTRPKDILQQRRRSKIPFVGLDTLPEPRKVGDYLPSRSRARQAKLASWRHPNVLQRPATLERLKLRLKAAGHLKTWTANRGMGK